STCCRSRRSEVADDSARPGDQRGRVHVRRGPRALPRREPQDGVRVRRAQRDPAPATGAQDRFLACAGRGMVGRMQGVADWKGYLAMPVRRTPDGRWRYRVLVDLPNGEQIRISGSAPRHNNTKDAAKQAEKDHILRTIADAEAAMK